MNNLVLIENLTHHYGKNSVLETINLQAAGSKMTGFIGPDGSGKSLLLSLISGVRKIQTGKITVFGYDMAQRQQREKMANHIAFMPQGLGNNLYGELSVAENIDYFSQLFAVPSAHIKAETQQLLERTGLSAFTDRRAKDLSGGMKQKLALCCALIHKPHLLVLDEPTTGVDPLSRQEFWKIIADMRLAHPALTILTATAYMEEAEAFDTLIMMYAGKILATGTPEELKQQTHTATLENAYSTLLTLSGYPSAPEAIEFIRTTPLAADAVVAVAAQDLSKKYGDFLAVDAISFSIKQGEIFGFVGPNGSGKTTTMNMLTGLLPPTAGSARIFGETIAAGSLEIRRHLGYMSQSFSLYSELTVMENLKLHAGLFDLSGIHARKAIARVLELCDLIGMEKEQSAQLPLGQKQRLSLAVAILHQPKLLILDEPTSGVDPLTRNRFWGLIFMLAIDHKMTVFVSTHYLNEAQRCHRIALMHNGRLLACDSPQQLLQNTQTTTLEQAFIHYIQGAQG